MKTSSLNLTEGSILKNIIFFSAPFLLSNFLQTFYGMADVFIVGQFNKSDSISAVSIGSQVMHMLTVMILGLLVGSSVRIAQAVGARDSRKTAKLIGCTAVFFTAFSIFLMALLLFFVKPIVHLVSTPPESVAETISYLTICFIGLPFIASYNTIVAVFRGLGDSKTPMYFVVAACILNIALDFLFIGVMGLKAGGAALATIISQGVSVVLGLFVIFRLGKKGKFRAASLEKLERKDFSVDSANLSGILKIGVPVAAQDGFVQISFMIITIIANRRGVNVAAAVGIVEKIICFLFLIPSAMLSSISSIAAQNIGANQRARAKKTLFTGTLLACGIGLFFALITQILSEPVLYFFTKEREVVLLGIQYLKSYVFDCIFAAVHFCFSGYFCAIGKSLVCFIHNSISIILIRIPGAFLASKYWPETLYPMGWAAPLGSLLSAVICIFAFLVIERKNSSLVSESLS